MGLYIGSQAIVAVGYKEYAARLIWSTANSRIEPSFVFSNTLGGPVLWGSEGTPAGVTSGGGQGSYLTLPEPVQQSQFLIASGVNFAIFDEGALLCHGNIHLGLNNDASVPEGFFPEVHFDVFDPNDEPAPELINYWADFHFVMRIYPVSNSP